MKKELSSANSSTIPGYWELVRLTSYISERLGNSKNGSDEEEVLLRLTNDIETLTKILTKTIK